MGKRGPGLGADGAAGKPTKAESIEGLAALVAELAATRGGHVLLKGRPLGDLGAAAVASALGASGVTVLNLSQCSLNADGARSLASAISTATDLTELNLSSNDLGHAGAAALASALESSCSLTRLNLSACELGDDGALSLVAALPCARALCSLNLRRNGLSAETCRRIVDAVAGTRLTELSLAANSAEVAVLADLELALTRNMLRSSAEAESPSCDLRARGLGDTAAVAIAEALPKLRHLLLIDLRGNSLTSVGIVTIYEALLANTSISEISIAGCPAAGTPAARRLAGRLACNALRQARPADTVRVAGDRGLGDEGTEEVAAFLASNPQIVSLGLQHNSIGPTGAFALAGALPAAVALRELLIYSNSLGAEGAAAIARALPPQLTALDVGSNALGDAGAQAVASAISEHLALTELHLDYNGIAADGACAFMKLLKVNRTLTKLWLHGNDISESDSMALGEAIERNRSSIVRQQTPRFQEPDDQQIAISIPALRGDALGTCMFADRVAELSISEYLARCGSHALGARGQVVLATFLIHDPSSSPSLWVVAMGVGTKFMPRDAARADGIRRNCVRDSHAEVLARRALLKYLYAQIAFCMDGGQSDAMIVVPRGGRYALRDGVTLHLYVSTAPCGRASASKEEGSRITPPLWSNLGPDAFPAPPDLSSLCAATPPNLLAKGSGDAGAPPGCVRLASAADAIGIDGVSLSCSDKIARWQELGLEGALLSNFVDGPLRLSTITMGRKFAYQRCQNALCWGAHPVAVMQAGISLEATVASARGNVQTGPQFEKGDGDESLTWALGDTCAESHDGRTGERLSAIGVATQAHVGAPAVAGSQLLDKLNELCKRCERPSFSSYRHAKDSAAKERRSAREQLLVVLTGRSGKEQRPESDKRM